LEANATSKEKMAEWESLTLVYKGVLVGYSSTRKAYKCYNLRLNKVVESINVTIDETGGRESKEEENESVEQLYEEEAKELEEEVYIEQPEGFQLSENADYVCKLKKALYGLKQAPRAWYSRLDKYLQQAGFRKGSADNNLYIKVTQDSILLIEVYVDDIIFGSTDDRLSQKFAKDMQNEFEMSLLGELSFFLGLQIRQSNQGIFISQTKYIREMLKRFGMEDCKPVTTPMQTSCKLRKDDDSKSTDQRQYRSMIGSLLYVTTSRPDVMQAVGQVARFQAAPKESHVLAVKRIFRYLKGT
jgi:hypothetical protein